MNEDDKQETEGNKQGTPVNLSVHLKIGDEHVDVFELLPGSMALSNTHCLLLAGMALAKFGEEILQRAAEQAAKEWEQASPEEIGDVETDRSDARGE